MPKNAKPGKIILGILILLTVEGSICRVDIPWYEGLISLGMKRSGNEGTMGKHEKTLRGGEEPPKKLPLVVLTTPQPLSTSSSPPTLQFKQKFGEL